MTLLTADTNQTILLLNIFKGYRLMQTMSTYACSLINTRRRLTTSRSRETRRLELQFGWSSAAFPAIVALN
jgi:hypothetical protein